MRNFIRPALGLFVLFTLIFGIIYPAISTLVIQIIFPSQSQGSLIVKNGNVIGSKLIGQNFTESKYFWGRLSATSPYSYNATASSGSNLGAANPDLLKQVKDRINALKKADPKNTNPIPVDLVTASASGLDPHISPAAAQYQIARVAKARHLSVEEIAKVVSEHTSKRQFGIFGEPTVNVLELNIALDNL